jgi:hypothetical protein
MFILRLDKSLRVACGVALLWLLVVQEKLCPWLLTPPSEPDSSAVAPGSAPRARPASEKRPKPRLPHILPDTLIPRWPAGSLQQTLRQAGDDRAGVVSCGQQHPGGRSSVPVTAADADLLGWRRFQCCVQVTGPVLPGGGLSPHVDPAVQTCICRTGPPRS